MGHKVNPTAFRIAVQLPWTSKWFRRGTEYADFLRQDQTMRKYIKAKLKDGGIAKIEVLRNAKNTIEVVVHVARPGLVIGHGGQKVEEVKKYIKEHIIGAQAKNSNIQLSVKEVQKPGLSAQVMVGQIAGELERRIPFRRVMKSSIEQVMKAGALGVKVQVAGRLNGAEIARTETLTDGRMPLQTLRACVDYSRGAARTTYGAIGVKVWVYTGDVFDADTQQ